MVSNDLLKRETRPPQYFGCRVFLFENKTACCLDEEQQAIYLTFC